MFFFLIATQSDPTLLYNESHSYDENENRSRENLCGLTIVCVKRPSAERTTYRGLCLRSAWTKVEKDTFDQLKPWLIFRDKCCNQRNFANLVPMVNTTRRSASGKRERSLPHGCQLLQSTYQYNKVAEHLFPTSLNDQECIKPEKRQRRQGVVTLPLTANRFANGLSGPPSNERYVEFYQQVLTFIRNEIRIESKHSRRKLLLEQVPIFHKLPSWMSSWLCSDLSALEPNLQFEYVGSNISAKNVYTSPHCRYRINHNACICEICLMDEYGAQLVSRMQHSRRPSLEIIP